MNDEWIGIWKNAVVNHLMGQSRLSAAETEEIHIRMNKMFSGRQPRQGVEVLQSFRD
jgi:hypothetical protein